MGAETLIYAQLAGQTVSAVSSIQAGAQASAGFGHAAGLSDFNEEVARDRAEYEAGRQESRLRRVLGMQASSYAGSGVRLEGSVQEVFDDSFVQGELDRLSIFYGGDLEAINHQQQAASYRIQADSARFSGLVDGLGTGLSGFAGAYSSDLKYNDGNLFGGGSGSLVLPPDNAAGRRGA